VATRPDLISCVGGNRAFAKATIESGWLYGARLPTTIYEQLYFADQDWKNPDRENYMAALAIHRPDVATVLDWEQPEQLPEVLAWAEEAAQYCRRVVVVPKVSGQLDRIPERIGGAEIVLGYSVPTSYGGAELWLGEFGRRAVHLLGGSPQKQMRLFRYLNVVSADGNMAHQQAHRCRAWQRKQTDKGHWVQLSKLGDPRSEGANLEAFRISLAEIKAAWDGLLSNYT
jgi:hypothetical protein